MTVRCRVCSLRLSSSKVRYQMTRRAPDDVNIVKLWWLCRLHYDELQGALDTVRETYYGPPAELEKVGVYAL